MCGKQVQREVAFGKKNLSANSNITSGFWTGTLTKTYRLRSPGPGKRHSQTPAAQSYDSFLQRVDLPDHLHSYYGAPARVWTRFDFPRSAASRAVNITLSMFNKTRTRLPEAHWMDFEIAVPVPPPLLLPPLAARAALVPTSPAPPTAPVASTSPGSGTDNQAGACASWTVSKLSSTFCATDVSLFGSTHIHAVSDEGGVSISSGQVYSTSEVLLLCNNMYAGGCPD